MTPREVQLSVRAAGQRQRDFLDVAYSTAWFEAGWASGKLKMPRTLSQLIGRKEEQPRTYAAEHARWEQFFASCRGTN